MTSETLSVVIPNWNGEPFLRGCLSSLLRQTAPPQQILVVDNASSDESVALIRRDYPQVELLCLPSNRGFAGGVNAGIERARGSLVALFNQDAEADPSWAAALMEAAKAHPEAGAFASKIVLFDPVDHFHSAGDLYCQDGVAANRGVWQRDTGQYDDESYVFGACGAAAVYRREVFDRVGLFDEAFFMYYEDVDMAWRHQIAGWPTLYVPGALVYHHLGASGGGVVASYFGARNTIYVLARDVPTPLLARYWRPIVKRQLQIAWEALRAWRGSAARARLRGLAAGLVTWPRMWRQRQVIQSSRQVSVEYLDSLLSPIDEGTSAD